jgi:hypothetical protein
MQNDPNVEERSKLWPENDFGLYDEIERRINLCAHEDSESNSLLQLFHARPEEEAMDAPAKTARVNIGFDGLKKLGFNIMRECLDNGISRIAKKNKIRILTAAATEAERQAAVRAERWVNGVRDQQKHLQKATACLYDACLNARGYGYAMWERGANGQPVLVRLDFQRTFVSANRDRGMVIRYMDRREVLSRYGKTEDHKAAIKAALTEHPEHLPGVDSGSGGSSQDDTIKVAFGWIVKCGDEKGKQTVQLDKNTVLESVEYKPHIIPIFPMVGMPGHRDGDADPVGRSLAPYAYWINGLNQKLFTQLAAQVPHVEHEEGQVVKAPNDIPFQRWTYAPGKAPPKITIPNTVSGEVIAHIDRLHESAERETGTPQGGNDSVLPPGVKSGLAIQEYRQEATIRLSQLTNNFADFDVGSTYVLLALAPHWFADHAALVEAQGTDLLESISWKTLNLPENGFTVQVALSGALPDSVSGRYEVMNGFKEGGLADELDMMEAFDQNPDLRALFAPKLAPRRLIRKQIDMALAESPVIDPPDGTQDVEWGYKETANCLANARLSGRYPQKSLDALLRLHLLFAQRRSQAAPAAPAPAPVAPTATPTPTATPALALTE